jgi:hypothetical protein
MTARAAVRATVRRRLFAAVIDDVMDAAGLTRQFRTGIM